MNGAGKTGQLHEKKKNQTGLPSHTMLKNKFKMD